MTESRIWVGKGMEEVSKFTYEQLGLCRYGHTKK